MSLDQPELRIDGGRVDAEVVEPDHVAPERERERQPRAQRVLELTDVAGPRLPGERIERGVGTLVSQDT
jgi:hypothetical protein